MKRYISLLPLSIALILIWLPSNVPAPCNTIPCYIAQDSELSTQYDTSVALHLTPNNSGKVLATIKNRKKRRAAKHFMQEKGRATEQSTNHSGNSKAGTCAVLGNSGNLLGSQYGTFIDGHDYIFRMNSAPVQTYERDVGTRTTHHILHSQWDIRDYGPSTSTYIIVKTRGFHLGKPKVRQKYVKNVGRYLRKLANYPSNGQAKNTYLETKHLAAPVYIMHPEFIFYITRNWWRPTGVDLNDKTPSTGIKTIIWALHMCDKVNVFGFGPDKGGFWDHYYEENKRSFRQHLPGYQEQLLAWLQEKHLITLYPGNAERRKRH